MWAVIITSLVTFTEKIHKMPFPTLNLRRTALLIGDEHFHYFIKSSHPYRLKASSYVMNEVPYNTDRVNKHADYLFR
jgi:hypothetical protein